MRKNPIILASIVLNTKWAFMHFMHDNMNRADILVRMLAIDDFYNKNDFGFNLYTEMQHARSRRNAIAEFLAILSGARRRRDWLTPTLQNRLWRPALFRLFAAVRTLLSGSNPETFLA